MPLGIPGIPRPALFGFVFSDNLTFLVLSIIIVIVVYLISRFVVDSSFGRVLKAVREDEKAIQVFGYRTISYKLAIFVIGAMMAAIAGALYAAYITYIDPSTFNVFRVHLRDRDHHSWRSCKLARLDHRRDLPRPASRILRFVGFPDEIAAQMRQAVYGLLLILLMLYRPQGLVGEYKL